MMVRYERAILFAGHGIDRPGRPAARFPARIEQLAVDVIGRRVVALGEAHEGSILGIASGAQGAEILFLEVCRDLGLDTRMVLPAAPEAFVAAAVAGLPDGDWEERFWLLWNGHGEDEREVIKPSQGNPMSACRTHMLKTAAALGKATTLIAYWDGAPGDDSDGTADFVTMARTSGAIVDHLDAAHLLRVAVVQGL